jgi:aspartyl-tRNA synthetase
MLQTHFRSHTCGQLNENNIGEKVTISGWIHRKRDHGGMLFIDLRDHFGITQLVTSTEEETLNKLSSEAYNTLNTISYESVITVQGTVVERSHETRNIQISTGNIEVIVDDYVIQSVADVLQLTVNGDQQFP